MKWFTPYFQAKVDKISQEIHDRTINQQGSFTGHTDNFYRSHSALRHAIWLVTTPSGRGLVIPFFFRFFFGGHLPQTSSFRSAKEILLVSFATQPRAFILSDRTIFYTPREGGENNGGV